MGDVIKNLVALTDFLRQHDHLAPTVANLRTAFGDLSVQVHPLGGSYSTHLSVLCAWGDALGVDEAVVTATATSTESGCVHLKIRGRVGEASAQVVAVVDVREHAALSTVGEDTLLPLSVLREAVSDVDA